MGSQIRPADWERALLQLSLRITGMVPVINGGAWWNKSDAFDDARTWGDNVVTRLAFAANP